VDRLPLVSSCIIQVAQDIDEPWPIEVYDHAGKAYNVTMQPGDMVLYESHTVLHGRPFPMKGRKYVRPASTLTLRFALSQPLSYAAFLRRTCSCTSNRSTMTPSTSRS
jgi:hypothetical protein